MNNEPHALCVKAEQLRERLYSEIASLADARMEETRVWFKDTFPGMGLKIIFGMGSEHITLGDGSRAVSFARQCAGFSYAYAIEVDPPKNCPDNSQRYTRPYFCLQPLAEALTDIMDITNGYRDGCPNDLTIACKETP